MLASKKTTLTWIMALAFLAMAAPTWAQTPIVLDPPAGTLDGVNVINGSTVIVQLRACLLYTSDAADD